MRRSVTLAPQRRSSVVFAMDWAGVSPQELLVALREVLRCAATFELASFDANAARRLTGTKNRGRRAVRAGALDHAVAPARARGRSRTQRLTRGAACRVRRVLHALYAAQVEDQVDVAAQVQQYATPPAQAAACARAPRSN